MKRNLWLILGLLVILSMIAAQCAPSTPEEPAAPAAPAAAEVDFAVMPGGALEKAIARYAGPKGNLQFPLDEPIPYDLIERIVRLRVKQDNEKAEGNRAKGKKK